LHIAFLSLCVSLGLFPIKAAPQDTAPGFKSDERNVVTRRLATSENDDQSPQTKDPQESPQKARQNKKEARGAIIAVPIPISSPAIGSGVALAGGYIFPFRKADNLSPPSTVGAAVLITDNGSRAFALGGEFYLKQNTYHVTTIYFRGNLNYDFYGTGTASGDAGLKQPLKQTGEVFLGEFLCNLGWKFFFGPRLLTGNSTITLREASGTTPHQPADIGIQTALTGVGFRLNRDTRPNRFYPTQGTLFDFTSTFFSEALGSKYSFQSYRSTFNYYRSFVSKQVFAYNLFLCATAGNAPFYGECVFGTNNELRGYVAGQYIDRDMIATQLEYRLELPWRFGMVAFGGLGEVAPSVSKFRYQNLLPAGGGGVRLKLSRKYDVNLRADFAQGKDGHTFSTGIGEAF
jgi:outer membrane protein assembly factor BamA